MHQEGWDCDVLFDLERLYAEPKCPILVLRPFSLKSQEILVLELELASSSSGDSTSLRMGRMLYLCVLL
jgi:hypothetical protein